MRFSPRGTFLVVAFSVAAGCSDRTTSPDVQPTVWVNVRGTVMEQFEDSVPVAGASVQLTVLSPDGTGAWDADSTDATGAFSVRLAASGCETGDSLAAATSVEATDFLSGVTGFAPLGLHLACDTTAQALDVSLYREVFRTPQPVAGSLEPLQISAGRAHACAIATDGAYCWGDNYFGKVGNPEHSWLPVRSPLRVAGGTSLTQIAAGYDHSCALDGSGAAWCWGDNWRGQLGVDTAQVSLAFQPVQVNTALRFVQIAAGRWHSCGLTADGGVYCWGDNRGTGIGAADTTGDLQIIPTPTRVAMDGRFVQIRTGYSHVCALQDTGDLYCWGFSYAGELGAGETPRQYYTPMKVLGGHQWATVGVGDVVTCALTTAGEAYCWGRDMGGRLGTGQNAGDSGTPTPVVGGHTFVGISAGGEAVCAWTSDGTAYCWGYNTTGAVGVSVEDSPPCADWFPMCVLQPTIVSDSLPFTALVAGGAYTCGITADQRIVCWGKRDNLGSGRLLN